jgi:hypothetical protein
MVVIHGLVVVHMYMVNAVARRIYGGDSLFWGKCNRIWRLEKLSRMECHNVTN